MERSLLDLPLDPAGEPRASRSFWRRSILGMVAGLGALGSVAARSLLDGVVLTVRDLVSFRR